MAFPGGSADKIGNEYEAWWTLRRVSQLLRGEIDAIAIEPLGAEGAELWVEKHGTRTYDQVKYRSSGQWTPSRLRSDGLLAKLSRHYAAGHQVLLLLSQPAEDLDRLADLARATSSGDGLWSAGESSSNDLELLRDAWGVGRDETWDYLSRTTVRHDGVPHLKEFVELALEMLLIGSVDHAVGVLREFLVERTNTVFTAPDVWVVLERAGISPRPRIEPGPTIATLKAALDRHMRLTKRTTPSAGTIERREVGEVVDALLNGDEPIILVSGKAGSGKSMVVADAAERLTRLGRHVTAVRVDRLDPKTSSAAQLGAAVELGGSPSILLSEVSLNGSDGILVIDQLDAVSDYSGRMPMVYEAVDEALTQARLLGNVRVVLAVRSIDLAEDPRLRKLAGENVPTIHVGDLDLDDVRAYVAQIGADAATLDSATMDLLRTPIHLYVFSELDDSLRSAPYRTLTSLYDAFTRSFRKRLELEGYPDAWTDVSRVLVERMNAEEALTVPSAALDHVSILFVRALVSGNILVEQENRLALFHETYFDYLFAKSFPHRGQALVDWFASNGQGLFRRSQLRQLLAYVASEERDKFVAQIVAIAESTLRPHLVSIAYTALAGFAPTPAEWKAIRHLSTTEDPFSARVVRLLSTAAWFTAADASGDIQALLDDPIWSDLVAGLVARLSAEIPERVYELLLPRQSLGESWVRALRTAIDHSTTLEWAEFAYTQVLSGGLDLPDEPFDVLDTPLFHRLVDTHTVFALKLLTLKLTRDIDRAIAENPSSLEAVLSTRGSRSIDERELQRLASLAPAPFVEAMLPLIERVATHELADGRQLWRYRVRGAHRNFDDEWFFTFGDALTQLMHDNPSRGAQVLEQLSGHGVESLDFLVCRALHAAPADTAADWILESEEHRTVGWISDHRWESRRLMEHASRSCSDTRYAALESTILFASPEYERRPTGLRRRGLVELQLLSALFPERLSPLANKRLHELRRKFPDWMPTEPTGIQGGTVQSPISRTAAEHMSNAQWLRAIARYDNNQGTVFRDGGAFGGADELASMMGTLAKEDPRRFLNLAMSFTPSTPPNYSEQVIRSVAGNIDQHDLIPLLRKFRMEHPADSGRSIVSAIDEYTEELDDVNRPDFRSYREPCPASAGWADSRSA